MAHAGKGEMGLGVSLGQGVEREEGEPARERDGFGPAAGLFPFLLLFFSLSFPHSNYSNNSI
jgi:hypothetical protein